MSKFQKIFNEVVSFFPEGYYLSKSLYTEKEAKHLLKKFLEELGGKNVIIKDIKVGYVRFQPTPEELREEGLANMAWITCESGDKNAQECWVYRA